MNIGAGRIVYQDLVRLNQEIASEKIADNPIFKQLVQYCRGQQKPLHLLGLLSDGGVHSTIHHLKGLIKILHRAGVEKVYIHAFMDGRDTSPNGGKNYLADLQQTLNEAGTGKIASIIGRYYAMDRDKRWERIKLAYDLLVKGEGAPFPNAQAAIEDAYAQEETDEFIQPRVMVDADGHPIATIQPDDAILFFNFRTDRGRQLTHALSQEDIPEQDMQKLSLQYFTMTRYDDRFKDVHVLYEKDQIVNGLGEFLAHNGKTQVRIAETEKYPHVTFFFNAGREEPMAGEKHLLCPSPKVATYDLQPEMSARDIQDKIIAEMEANHPDFICLNFANPDMVGHTGVFEAAVKACETVDGTTKAVVEAATKMGYACLITADHGNADQMRNPDGSPHTAHTTALVPLFLVDPRDEYTLTEETGKLGDLAPTILKLMGLTSPTEMTGDVLVQPKA